MGEERQFEFPEFNGIIMTRDDIDKILSENISNDFDLIESD